LLLHRSFFGPNAALLTRVQLANQKVLDLRPGLPAGGS